MENPAADSSITPVPALPRRVAVDAELNRFSRVPAPQRDVIDAFCQASRPWALRQAKRSYRHLPESLREQAVDRAYTELRTRTPASTERRALSAELAERLTESLRHVHVGWCLNESSALLRREGTEPVQPEVTRDELSGFVDSGLGGLERAILQLEIGAGRDTRTSRAALRLHPRAYAAQRESGLSKLRDAISAQVVGRACDQHVAGVVDAAMGDRRAMDALASGSSRCRFCAREAQGLRSVLHERLAIAPWPLAIKPAGLLAVKAGALGAIFGGQSAGAGAGAIVVGSGGGAGASMAASVLAIAALATGTAAVVGGDAATPRERVAGHSSSAQAVPVASRAPTAAAAARPPKAKPGGSAAARGQARRRGARRTSAGGSGGGSAPATTAPGSSAADGTSVASAPPSSGTAPSSGVVGNVTKPVTGAVDDTVQQVTSRLPAPVASPVQGVADDVTNTVDDVTNAADGLLPKP